MQSLESMHKLSEKQAGDIFRQGAAPRTHCLDVAGQIPRRVVRHHQSQTGFISEYVSQLYASFESLDESKDLDLAAQRRKEALLGDQLAQHALHAIESWESL